jgi:hypothetical protein
MMLPSHDECSLHLAELLAMLGASHSLLFSLYCTPLAALLLLPSLLQHTSCYTSPAAPLLLLISRCSYCAAPAALLLLLRCSCCAAPSALLLLRCSSPAAPLLLLLLRCSYYAAPTTLLLLRCSCCYLPTALSSFAGPLKVCCFLISPSTRSNASLVPALFYTALSTLLPLYLYCSTFVTASLLGIRTYHLSMLPLLKLLT